MEKLISVLGVYESAKVEGWGGLVKVVEPSMGLQEIILGMKREEYIRFFDTTPYDDLDPDNTCYCVSWCSDDHREMIEYPSREERRAMAAEYVKSGKIQGYLAYVDGKLAGWCNANTRSESMNCGGWLFTMHIPGRKPWTRGCFLWDSWICIKIWDLTFVERPGINW